MKRILLDTNAYAGFLSGDEDVYQALSDADAVWMSVFVIGELMAGFRGGNRHDANVAMLRSFLRKPTVSVLDATMETAEVFGQIKEWLKRAGTAIPINDVWIAAHALETGAVLVTNDSHFDKVPGLRLRGR